MVTAPFNNTVAPVSSWARFALANGFNRTSSAVYGSCESACSAVLAGLTGALLAQQDDVATTGETVASAAYLHGLAAAIASESEQQGWQEPELIGREHRQRFMTLGHPIVAGDVAHAIPEAIADVIA